jgi:hypothetical protein
MRMAPDLRPNWATNPARPAHRNAARTCEAGRTSVGNESFRVTSDGVDDDRLLVRAELAVVRSELSRLLLEALSREITADDRAGINALMARERALTYRLMI